MKTIDMITNHETLWAMKSTLLLSDEERIKRFENKRSLPIDLQPYQMDGNLLLSWIILNIAYDMQIQYMDVYDKGNKWFDEDYLEYVAETIFQIVRSPNEYYCKDMNDVKHIALSLFE